MKKYILQLLFLLVCLVLINNPGYSTDYQISFTGGGETTMIDSIQVTNLRSGTVISLDGNQSLFLKSDESGVPEYTTTEEKVHLFPNPNQGRAVLNFLAANQGHVAVTIHGIEGRQIAEYQFEAEAGTNTLELQLPNGIFLIKILGKSFSLNIKTISLSDIAQKAEIRQANLINYTYKAPASSINLLYAQGDRLLFRAYSGKFSTYFSDQPTSSKNIHFDFYACTDASGNHYPVVVLGNKVWMAENLRTNHFRNAGLIPLISDPDIWKSTLSAASCQNNNTNATTSDIVLLYNWHVISDSRMISPAGWYLPTDNDWFEIDSFLIANKLHYNQSSGFMSVNGGYRNDSGIFMESDESAAYWTSTTYDSAKSLSRKIDVENVNISRDINHKSNGLSLRCVRPVYGNMLSPLVITLNPTDIKSSGATCNGLIMHDGGSEIISSGICWNYTGSPTIADSKLISGSNSYISSNPGGLPFNTKFYVRAFAYNSIGISYGNEVTFNTLALNVFDIEKLPEITIEVTQSEWNKLLLYYDQNPHNEEKVVSSFSFTYDGSTTLISQTAFRLRGNTSRRRPEGNSSTLHSTTNPDWHHASFSVDMNDIVSGQKFAGLKKINLKWFKDDSMYSREVYCYDLFKKFGVWTAPESSYCKLYIHVAEDTKPAYFGVYELLESVDNDYLKKRKSLFGDDDGFLWKAFWGADFKDADASKMGIENVTLTSTYKPVYDLKNRPEDLEVAKTQLLQFIKDLNQKTGTDFQIWIESKTDVPLFLKTYAVNVMCGMWDDYWANKNNFYFYFNSAGKFYFIPYDYDNTLGTSQIMNDAGIQNMLKWGNSSYPLVEKIIAIPQYRKMYINFLHELSDPGKDFFHVTKSKVRILNWHALIKNHILNDTGEDMQIADRPASWGNCSFYRLLEDQNNFFQIKVSSLPTKIN